MRSLCTRRQVALAFLLAVPVVLAACRITGVRETDDSVSQLLERYTKTSGEWSGRDLLLPDVNTLAWVEAPVAESYLTMYTLYDDMEYLAEAHRILRRAFDALEPMGEFLAWKTRQYSAAMAWGSTASHNIGTGQIVPAETRVSDPRMVSLVTGATYRVVIDSETSYYVYVDEAGGGKPIGTGECPRSLGRTKSETLTPQHDWVHQVAQPGNNYWSVRTELPLLRDPRLVKVWRDGEELPFGLRQENSWNLRDDGRLNIWLPLADVPWKHAYVVEYVVACNLDGIPGVGVQIAGQPLPGDEFIIVTEAMSSHPYLVHDAMILQPALRFIQLAITDARLSARYGAQAREWLELIEARVVPQWEPDWREDGYYVVPKGTSERDLAPGEPLPFNQFLSYGRVLFLLHDLTGEASYLAKAARMAEYFKGQCSLTREGAYVWYYMPTGVRFEDTSHGNLVIGFVVDAHSRGVVFDQSDMVRFTMTFLKLMWNGSLDDPEVGTYVHEPVVLEGGRNYRVQEWVFLAAFDRTVWEVCRSVISRQKPADAHHTLQLVANLLWLHAKGFKL